MTNYVQAGNVVTLAAPYDRTSGTLLKVGGIVGVATTTVASGASVEVAVEGVFTLAKVSAQAWATVGLAIYWDDSAKLCTTTSSGNTKIGVNVATAADPSGTGIVRLNGSF